MRVRKEVMSVWFSVTMVTLAFVFQFLELLGIPVLCHTIQSFKK